jgi:hypothetical protein
MNLDWAQGPSPSIHTFAIKIMCWEPVYLENRVNGSHVVFADKPEVYIEKSAQQLYAAIARDHCVELNYMRGQYADAVGKRQNLPLLLTDVWELFSPVKSRVNPDNRNDGVTGYVNPKYIDRVYPGQNETAYIVLTNGYKMHVFMSSARVRERIKESLRFRDLYAFRHGAIPPEWYL